MTTTALPPLCLLIPNVTVSPDQDLAIAPGRVSVWKLSGGKPEKLPARTSRQARNLCTWDVSAPGVYRFDNCTAAKAPFFLLHTGSEYKKLSRPEAAQLLDLLAAGTPLEWAVAW